MPRDYRAAENQKRSKARREHALQRLDLREPSHPRDSAVGPTSHAVKKINSADQAAIDAFMARKGWAR
jgi:hypothetical protein